jgi:uridylate kinase
MHADALLKATNGDGIYTADPNRDATAELLREITYQQVLEKNLQVMDAAAISLCRENNLPIVVFKLIERGNIRRVLSGERVGSTVRDVTG